MRRYKSRCRDAHSLKRLRLLHRSTRRDQCAHRVEISILRRKAEGCPSCDGVDEVDCCVCIQQGLDQVNSPISARDVQCREPPAASMDVGCGRISRRTSLEEQFYQRRALI